MSNTALSDIVTKSVALSGPNASISALGDGTAKAGDAVGLTSAGKVAQTATTTAENFVGFLDVRYDTDKDTAISDGDPCKIVVPESGKKYGVHMVDPAATALTGAPVGFSATAGALEVKSALSGAVAVLAESMASGDTYGLIRWL